MWDFVLVVISGIVLLCVIVLFSAAYSLRSTDAKYTAVIKTITGEYLYIDDVSYKKLTQTYFKDDKLVSIDVVDRGVIQRVCINVDNLVYIRDLTEKTK